MKLTEIIKQLEKSEFTNIAGSLEDHVAFVELKKKAENNEKAICCLGDNPQCMLNVNGGYCRAMECQFRVVEIED